MVYAEHAFTLGEKPLEEFGCSVVVPVVGCPAGQFVSGREGSRMEFTLDPLADREQGSQLGNGLVRVA